MSEKVQPLTVRLREYAKRWKGIPVAESVDAENKADEAMCLEAADTIDALTAKLAEAVRELVRHAWVHSGYADCGYNQMTSEQKALYDVTTGRDAPEWMRGNTPYEQARAALASAPPQTATAEGGVGVSLIAAERRRQIEAEGYTPEHDDQHGDGELARAAAYYAAGYGYRLGWLWPFDEGPKPHDRRRELVVAGALIAAEIDRLQRMSAAHPPATDAATEAIAGESPIP